MGVALEYVGETVIGFDDDSYRWFSVKRFGWDCRGDDSDVLAGLIGHPQYRWDTYMEPGTEWPDSDSAHGPYELDAITPAGFEPVSPDGVAARVEEFYGLFDHPPRPEVRAQVDAAVLAPLASAGCYQLRHLPDAVHANGCVFLEFRELVAISRADGAVLIVIMAADL